MADVYQFQGWFGLVPSTDEADVSVVEQAVQSLRVLVTELSEHLPLGEIRALNGEHFLFVAGAGNRPRDTPDKLQMVLDTIATSLPGSYGLLYERDDEQPDPALANTFTVRVLARGKVTQSPDPFLSPIVPTIED